MGKGKQIGLRLNEDELRRLSVILQRASERTCGYITISDVIKELSGLVPMRALHPADRDELIKELSGNQKRRAIEKKS